MAAVAGCGSPDEDGTETANETTAATTTESPSPTETPAPETATPEPSLQETPAETPEGTPAESTETAAEPLIEMEDTAFVPMELSVAPGTEVRWVNRDGIPHDVTSAQFNDGATQWTLSERVGPGEEVTYEFEDAGTYEYYCAIHGQSTMCGVVLVGDASRAGPLPCE